ncbi:unnamed protein product [Vitrella brassicaformis CCMP3155]|uniref:Uncharacterized protein n=1 Tax=Vitrella brassicaformis (strain CCMP3155) TaxID=1169540 RepID=A0A0G4FPK8_VITBC|nr:unnamed protein product [Vitrella brassicaformis CCMP3155]|eukprot:CEM15943.1 unnamed protein product [Vitrella brassicaformis CCMP3155]
MGACVGKRPADAEREPTLAEIKEVAALCRGLGDPPPSGAGAGASMAGPPSQLNGSAAIREPTYEEIQEVLAFYRGLGDPPPPPHGGGGGGDGSAAAPYAAHGHAAPPNAPPAPPFGGPGVAVATSHPFEQQQGVARPVLTMHQQAPQPPSGHGSSGAAAGASMAGHPSPQLNVSADIRELTPAEIEEVWAFHRGLGDPPPPPPPPIMPPHLVYSPLGGFPFAQPPPYGMPLPAAPPSAMPSMPPNSAVQPQPNPGATRPRPPV